MKLGETGVTSHWRCHAPHLKPSSLPSLPPLVSRQHLFLPSFLPSRPCSTRTVVFNAASQCVATSEYPSLNPLHMIPLSDLITSFQQPYILLRRMPGTRRFLSIPLHRILSLAFPQSSSHDSRTHTGAHSALSRHVSVDSKVGGLPASLPDLV